LDASGSRKSNAAFAFPKSRAGSPLAGAFACPKVARPIGMMREEGTYEELCSTFLGDSVGDPAKTTATSFPRIEPWTL
jgi:hypothetical protein